MHYNEYKIASCKEVLDQLGRSPLTTIVALDTETTSKRWQEAELVGVSLYWDGEGYYIPVAHSDCPANEHVGFVVGFISHLYQKYHLVGHNIHYDFHIIEKCLGLPPPEFFTDTQVVEHWLDMGTMGFSLDKLTMKYFNHKNIEYKEITKRKGKKILFSEVDVEVACKYAVEDAETTYRLMHAQTDNYRYQTMTEQPHGSLAEAFKFGRVLFNMQKRGVKIDIPYLKNLTAEFTEKAETVRKSIYNLAGKEFNLNSPVQVAEVLYKEQGYPVLKKTATGNPSCDIKVLQQLAEEYKYDLPREILEFRGYSKLISTYTKTLPKLCCPDGRVRTSYNQCGTHTGRLSSSGPNLQNIPKRSEDGERIRRAFIAEEGKVLIAADYSQMELRIMAHFSADPALIEAFKVKGSDVHQEAAARMGVGRSVAKAINFGLMYGMTYRRLSRELDIEEDEAKQHIENYFKTFEGVDYFMRVSKATCAQHGFAETLCKYRRSLPHIYSEDNRLASAAERQACNTPIQGTAADIIRLAMIDLDKEDDCGDLLLQIHDELVFEVDADKAEKAKEKIVKVMENIGERLELKVPLVVEAGIGNNWGEAH